MNNNKSIFIYITILLNRKLYACLIQDKYNKLLVNNLS